MSYSTANHIFIGNFAIMDNDESDWDTDNPDAVKGTYGIGDMEMVTVTQFDDGDDGILYDDEGGTADSISYTTSTGSYSGPIDASVLYNAVITEADGTQTTLQVVVKQMPNGDSFIVDREGAPSLDNMQITQIELTSPASTNFVGAYKTYSVNNTTVCFVSGTLIDTPQGPTRIERLRPGDQVITADNGPQTLRWIGGQRLARPGPRAPVEIAAGALGNALPTHALAVSPQHRILVQSPIVQRMFGIAEVLVPALRLLDHPGVAQAPGDTPTRYWHMLFDRHEVVCANGIWAESLFLGPEAVKTLGAAAVAEILSIFAVDSLDDLAQLTKAPARPVPAPNRQKRLAQRHIANMRAWQAQRPAMASSSSRGRA
ncbi:Hint domain-containing protein [Gymnodinialimonas sp. 57CJ19]|uniref:Hint domain-containing protein n=1 Tax=Gymnodinialimonas sp. 57CJ19 TaxID=3138498 RepID=UPI003134637C